MTVPSPAVAAVEAAAAVLGPLASRDEPLGPLTTYRVGGPAALLARPRTLDELAPSARPRPGRLPVLVVGRGSNLLVADTGFPGIAVSAGRLADEIEVRRRAHVVPPAGGAVALPTLARRTAAAGLTGFEWAVGVPGSIGGAVRMNAGGHGSDMAACLRRRRRGRPARGRAGAGPWPVERLGLRFRGSDLADHQVVVAARARPARRRPSGRRGGDRRDRPLASGAPARRPERRLGVRQPRPRRGQRGALIDELGLRGLRVGTAWVSEKHANFIQADEGGRAADVRAVMEEVRQRVADELGYRLRSEVRLVGFEGRRVPERDDGRGAADDAAPSRTADAPSAEVARRAAAGVLRRRDRRAKLQRIDLDSPEVDELIAGSPARRRPST